MSALQALGNTMGGVGQSPDALQGLMLLMAGHGAERQGRWDAVNRQVGMLGDAMTAHQAGQGAIRGGFDRAHGEIFGPGAGSASSQLYRAISDIGPMLDNRGAELGALTESAAMALGQEQAARGASNRAPGGGSAFDQATANAAAADTARNDAFESYGLGGELPGDYSMRMGERAGEGRYGAMKAASRAGMERDIGSIMGAGHGAISGLHRFQASQQRPKWNPMASFARAAGVPMMQRGFPSMRRRAPMMAGPGMPDMGMGGGQPGGK